MKRKTAPKTKLTTIALVLLALVAATSTPVHAGSRSFTVTPANQSAMGFDLRLDYDRASGKLAISFPAERSRKGGVTATLDESTLVISAPALKAPLAVEKSNGKASFDAEIAEELFNNAVIVATYKYPESGDIDQISIKISEFGKNFSGEKINNPH